MTWIKIVHHPHAGLLNMRNIYASRYRKIFGHHHLIFTVLFLIPLILAREDVANVSLKALFSSF